MQADTNGRVRYSRCRRRAKGRTAAGEGDGSGESEKIVETVSAARGRAEQALLPLLYRRGLGIIAVVGRL